MTKRRRPSTASAHRQDTLKADDGGTASEATTPIATSQTTAADDNTSMMNRLMRLWPWGSLSKEEQEKGE
jgi:hypothetical protein